MELPQKGDVVNCTVDPNTGDKVDFTVVSIRKINENTTELHLVQSSGVFAGMADWNLRHYGEDEPEFTQINDGVTVSLEKVAPNLWQAN